MDRKDSAPDVRSYLDAVQFLQDVYSFHKELNPRFSYDVWAKEMGLNSKSYLRFAVLGQRGISPELTQKLSEFLKLEGNSSEYFSLLVLFSQCPQPDQKKLLGRRLTQLLRQELPVDEVNLPASVVASPLAVTVRNILSYTDIPRTEEFLVQLLKISREDLWDILSLLEKENLIKLEGEHWTTTHESIRVTDKTKGETRQYHKLSLLKAIESQSMPVDIRHFRSVGLALSSEEYQSYLQELDQFVKSVFAKYDSDELRSRRVYQMNFNVFPWTDEVQK
jgi:uncharacterized protein (TIGR02147 family)